ncbi:MAG TPA: TlpA disulfide reductase family protein [Polyangia bacterium]|jgi:thiol-disulfide isomerase/thioredoxin|nr:TlpA disulfide reductase family protein [Polyangia bacterium]
MSRLKIAWLLALGGLACLGARPALALEPGQKAIDFKLPALAQGQGDITLKAFAGKVVLLDFWASWCEPCREELPELEKLQKQYAARGLATVAVNLDQQRADADQAAKKLRLAAVSVALDPSGSVADKYDLPKMPSLFVLDRTGVVRFVHAGYGGPQELAQLKKEIEQLLGK